MSMLRYAIALVLLAFAFGGSGVKPSPQKYINLEGYNVLILTDTSVGSDQNPIWLNQTSATGWKAMLISITFGTTATQTLSM